MNTRTHRHNDVPLRQREREMCACVCMHIGARTCASLVHSPTVLPPSWETRKHGQAGHSRSSSPPRRLPPVPSARSSAHNAAISPLVRDIY
jgi:hypothetical protein